VNLILPLQDAIKKFSENMYLMMSILKTFMQCLKNLKDNFDILNEEDDEGGDSEKRELKLLLRSVYNTANKDVKELHGKLFLLSCLVDFFF